MESTFSQITNYILTQSWQMAALVAVVALVNLALRNRSAHVRYLLWLIVLAKCFVPPLLSVPLAVLPEDKPMPVLETRPVSRAEPVSLSPAPVRPRLPQQIVPSRSVRPARLTPRQWFGLSWILGVVAFILIALTKALRNQLWLKRKRKALPVAMQLGIEDLFSGLGVKRFPKVWLVEGIGQPFVWGVLRGGIYLPANFVKVNSAEHRRDVLGHELSHVLRFDAAINLLQTIAQALFWFHPFVWWANRKIRAEREKCCDEMAIACLNTQVKNYSRAIIETLVTEYESTRPVPSLAVAGPVKNIEERIKTMLRPGKKFYKRPSLVAAIVVLLIALLTVPTALVLTARAQEKTTAASPSAPTAKDKAAATAALFRAIRDKNVERMRLAINQGADLEGKNKDTIFLLGNVQSVGCTPLYVAVGVPEAKKNLVGLLLEAGANPNTRGPDGQIPLHAAARRWDISIVKMLVSAGSDVNAADKEGRTPATVSFELGHYDTFALLVDKGATVSADLMSAYNGNLSRVKSLIDNGKAQERFGRGLTLLHAAAAGGHTTIADLLLTNGLDVTSKTQAGYTAMHYAAAGNHRKVAELLLAKGADVNTELGRQTPLHWAIREQHKDMIDWLLARGANPNADGGDYWGTPLHWAVWWWDIDTALLLVSHGGDIHLKTQKFPYSPLLDSVLKGHRAMVEALVTKAGDTKAAKWALLLANVVSGDLQAVEDLLARGADVNAKGEMGWSALHLAAMEGHKDIAKLLIEKGADVSAKSKSGSGSTPLHVAAYKGYRDVAELLIAGGADVNAKDERDFLALHLAAGFGHKDIVELLIEKGADVNARAERSTWDEGMTALHGVCAHGRKDIAELLIAKGADVNAKSKNGSTPLHVAATEGYRDVAELLITKGADVNAKDNYGRPPLSLAKNRSRTEVAELLRKHGARDDSSAGTNAAKPTKSLHEATAAGDIEQVKLLIRNGADVNAKDNEGHAALHHAASKGHTAIVRLLIAHGANVNLPDEKGFTPLTWVVWEGGEKAKAMIELLISKGADVNVQDKMGYTPLYWAAFTGSKSVFAVLLDKVVEPTTIHLAASKGDLAHVKKFIEGGKDVNVKDIFGCTPLHWAVLADTNDVADFLIGRGAELAARDNTGFAPIMVARGQDMIELLISEGADVNVRMTGNGRTRLHTSCLGGEEEMAEFLITHGADVNVKDKWGNTPLHLAASKGHVDVVKLLLMNQADINAKGIGGYTPLWKAQEKNHTEVVALLRTHRAKE